MTYVPQAMAAMGSEMDASQAVYYAASQLYTPDDLSSYGSDEYNNLTDPLDAAGLNHWTTIDLAPRFWLPAASTRSRPTPWTSWTACMTC